jgi:FkbH-like protein
VVVDVAGHDAAARSIRANRAQLTQQIAAIVADWPKYAEAYRADPEGFAEIEVGALVDYMAGLLDSGDVNYRHLYIGEKAKQFFDPATPEVERRKRQADILANERAAFASTLAGDYDALKIFEKHFSLIETALMQDAARTVRILFVGDCLFLDVIAFLTAPLMADGIRIDPVFLAAHDSSEVVRAISDIADDNVDLIFFSPLTYAFITDYNMLQRSRAVLSGGVKAHCDGTVAAASSIFDTLADLFDCPIVVHLPAAILRNDGSLRDRLRSVVTAPARNAAVTAVREMLIRKIGERTESRAFVAIDEQNLVKPVGIDEAGRYFYKSALQHPARFGAIAAAHYRDVVFAAVRLAKCKVIVCDLDNTLWDGVIGEGLGVSHYPDRHAVLSLLKARGVVLTINSKNDPEKVHWQADAGLLSIDDFASRQINWEPKALNIERIADHLNLKVKDFVFIDDRADERAMVSAAYPEIATLDATEARSWQLLQLWADILPAKPDADRTDFYRQRDARQAFIATDADADDSRRAEAYAALDLKLTIREAGPADAERTTELINRTNQFNMAGSRVTRRHIDTLIANPAAKVIVADAEDRFGAMGTIAALTVERGEDILRITAFVLSCRVFGYGMEFAILESVRALAGDGDRLTGDYADTPHNHACRTVYPDAGFSRIDEGWERGGDGLPVAVPAWLNVEVRLQPLPVLATNH